VNLWATSWRRNEDAKIRARDNVTQLSGMKLPVKLRATIITRKVPIARCLSSFVENPNTPPEILKLRE
jgi:hypothetical protein